MSCEGFNAFEENYVVLKMFSKRQAMHAEAMRLNDHPGKQLEIKRTLSLLQKVNFHSPQSRWRIAKEMAQSAEFPVLFGSIHGLNRAQHLLSKGITPASIRPCRWRHRLKSQYSLCQQKYAKRSLKTSWNLQFLGIVAIRQTDNTVWQISPVWAGGSRNVTHTYRNKGVHFFANVISKNRLVLTATHL